MAKQDEVLKSYVTSEITLKTQKYDYELLGIKDNIKRSDEKYSDLKELITSVDKNLRTYVDSKFNSYQ